ncbi:disease resistance protein At4g27190 [Gossypium hirsutum]|uniref:Disease resistance protein At4g27190 n=1 Tax=Gossypium hirsutum TaxID=3635 RepID=A0A1U8KCA0_GOSHI|nr:disease resistance protein At4g27190-like [Gossypium hirsutum]
MEYVEPIFCIANCLGTPVCKYLQYHRKLNYYVRNFKIIRDELGSQMEDIELQLKAELLHPMGKIPKKGVENWLAKVKVMIKEAQDVENIVTSGRYVCRAWNGKLVDKKTREMKKLLHKVPNALGSLVIDGPSVGLPLPTSELVGEKAVKDEIWQCLMQEEEFDVVKLQDDIASALNLKKDLDKVGDKLKRAAFLSEMLKKAGKHILILDDVWDKISLEEVGIPEPTSGNGCKMVLTTRSEQVCKYIDCKVIIVKPLSEEESLILFLNKVGPNIVQSPTLMPTLRLVVKECTGLPLTIVVVAGTLKGENEPRIWKNALKELKERIGKVEGVEAEVIERLKFSFDHLKDDKVKHCFLYCAFYPEDFKIPKNELIEGWIDEGFIDEMDTREEMKDKGHVIMKKLEDNCLLEKCSNHLRWTCVKMHDAVRDMALSITNMNSRCMIQAGKQSKKLLKKDGWMADVEKVSLMRNSISRILKDGSSPQHQLLKTLLLQDNPIEKIPNSFFANMPSFSVLNLSRTKIERLPNSISKLENLTTLLLDGCQALRYLPCLSKLQGLKKLNLCQTKIEKAPEGMDMLINLRYLDLYVVTLKEIPIGLLPKLSRLQHLSNVRAILSSTGYRWGLHVGNMKEINLYQSMNLNFAKTLFAHWLLPNLQNLEEIWVEDCDELVEILGTSTLEDHQDAEKGSDAFIKFNLPKLRNLELHALPELKSICSKSGAMVCDSLQVINVSSYDKLKRIPPFVPLIGNGQPYGHAPPSLNITSSTFWWESLEWDDPNFKNVLQPHWHPW